MDFRVCAHCTNDGRGEYSPRVIVGGFEEVFIGMDAINYLEKVLTVAKKLYSSKSWEDAQELNRIVRVE